jgi:hypothetical protein
MSKISIYNWILIDTLPPFLAAGVGGQNSTLISTSGNSVTWATNWTWANGPNNVKSCADLCIILIF